MIFNMPPGSPHYVAHSLDLQNVIGCTKLRKVSMDPLLAFSLLFFTLKSNWFSHTIVVVLVWTKIESKYCPQMFSDIALKLRLKGISLSPRKI